MTYDCLSFVELARFATMIGFEIAYADAFRIVLEKGPAIFTWLNHGNDVWCVLGSGGEPA